MGMNRIRPDHLKAARKLVGDFLAHEGHQDESPEINVAEIGQKLAEIAGATTKAAVMSGSLIGGASAEPLKVRVTPNIEHRLEQSRYSKADIEALAKNIISEAEGEPTEGQLAVMQVTVARLIEGVYGHNIHSVVYQKGQFAWTADEMNARASKNPDAVNSLIPILEKFMQSRSPREIVQHLSEITSLPTQVTHFRKIGGKYSLASHNFFNSLVRAGEKGRHEFFMTKSAAAKLAREEAEKIMGVKTAPSQADELPPPQHRVQKSRGS